MRSPPAPGACDSLSGQQWGCLPAQMCSGEGSCQQRPLTHTPHLVLNPRGKEQVVLNPKPAGPTASS